MKTHSMITITSNIWSPWDHQHTQEEFATFAVEAMHKIANSVCNTWRWILFNILLTFTQLLTIGKDDPKNFFLYKRLEWLLRHLDFSEKKKS